MQQGPSAIGEGVGIYEFRGRRSDRWATPDYAIRRARVPAGDAAAYLPRALHEERDLPDLHRIVDQVDEIR